ncbi:helix-turn-helix domain-containing protein [Sporosarcina obsidiansis]|uniref:helix-turn-helix domain-containing protein n=1 Tax=Sporosarcina obsidiansis TaxID=2660748 RepID=UPI00129BC84C|nr:helix-turn-helix domain-containing protein [Sporosarcina obsidiansis]
MNSSETNVTENSLYEVLDHATFNILKAVGENCFFKTVLEEMIGAFVQFDTGFLFIFSEKTNKLIVKYAIGYVEENYRKTQLKPGEGITGLAFETNEPQFFTSREDIMKAMRTMTPFNLSHYIQSTIQAEYPHQTLALPLKDGQGTMGVVTMNGHDPSAPYPDDLLKKLQAFASVVTMTYRYHLLIDRANHLEKELALTTKALHKEHDQQQKTADLYNELTMLSNQKKGIGKMVTALQQYVEVPVALYDSLFNLIAQHGSHSVPLPPGMISTKEVQYVIATKKWQVYTGENGVSIIITPIVGSDSVMGFLLAFMQVEEVHQVNRMLLEYGASLLSLEMIKQHSIKEAQQMFYGELFDKVLLGVYDNQLDEQAKNLGLFPRDFYVALICSDSEQAAVKDSRYVREKWMQWIEEALEFHYIKGIVTERNQQIIAFMSFPELEGKERAVEKLTTFSEYLCEMNKPIFIGIGRVYDSFRDIQKSFDDAEKSLVLLQKKKNARVHLFSESGVNRILLDMKRNELELFLVDHLGVLMDESNQEFLETLLVYVANNKALKLTTEKLMIHQNTLYYRLKRIETLLDIKLTDPERWFDVQLACKIYEYLN